MSKFTDFTDSVMKAEGLSGWTYKITTAGGLCMHDSKRLLLLPDDYALVLHEVAHAVLPKPDPKKSHDVFFGDKLTHLIRKYMIPA